jgi:hypothetical protein
MDYDLSLETIIVHPEIILIIVQTFDIRVILMSIYLGSIWWWWDRCLDSIWGWWDRSVFTRSINVNNYAQIELKSRVKPRSTSPPLNVKGSASTSTSQSSR